MRRAGPYTYIYKMPYAGELPEGDVMYDEKGAESRSLICLFATDFGSRVHGRTEG